MARGSQEQFQSLQWKWRLQSGGKTKLSAINHNVKKNPSESGISILIVLVIVFIVLLSMRSVFNSIGFANKSAEKLSDDVSLGNYRRYVQQVIADDQLCMLTDFTTGITGWETSKISSDKTLKDNGNMVSFAALQDAGFKWWPMTKHTESFRTGKSGGKTISGPATIDSVVFVQPSDREIRVTKNKGGRTITRIPIDVREKGTINGLPVVWTPGIATYIELTDDGSAISACYKDVSSRSLCINAGGSFDPAQNPKCDMP